VDAATRGLFTLTIVAAVCLGITACTIHFYYLFFRRPTKLLEMFPDDEWRRYSWRQDLLPAIYGVNAAIGTGTVLYTGASSLLSWLPSDIRLVVAINFGWWGTVLISKGTHSLARRIAGLERAALDVQDREQMPMHRTSPVLKGLPGSVQISGEQSRRTSRCQ
jgi:hypothetical protein